ncbi:hypothetical protein KFK09_014287 [Dendrobium nobile]|uniref:Uncharacterized protein n=1 Tax=Dendrobium nobile TaxID=94219 RepID=A0A8T3B9G6_DENNO|nr:hypothetical protein KFK09_014287 [Dendrobium nobile]
MERISTDLTSGQQNGVSFRKKNSDDNAFARNLNVIDEHSNNLGQCSLRRGSTVLSQLPEVDHQN